MPISQSGKILKRSLGLGLLHSAGMHIHVPRVKLYFLLLALCSALFPVLYFSLDPSVLDITDRLIYESVFSSDLSADTAFYPLFLAITTLVSSLTDGNYEITSLIFAGIFYASSVALFGWQLGKSFKPSALYIPMLSTLVLFSYYNIKTGFALKKLAVGLSFVNLSFLSDSLILILVLRASALLIHPQLSVILLLPNSVGPLGVTEHPRLFLRIRRCFFTIQRKSISASALLLASLGMIIIFIRNTLPDAGELVSLFTASLQYKFNYYASESNLDFQLILFFLAISLPLLVVSAFYLIFGDMPITTKLYYISISAYLLSVLVFGTSRLFLLAPYLLYPLRQKTLPRRLLIIFLSYAFFRSLLVFSGVSTFS